jgi:hypothetical protein
MNISFVNDTPTSGMTWAQVLFYGDMQNIGKPEDHK